MVATMSAELVLLLQKVEGAVRMACGGGQRGKRDD